MGITERMNEDAWLQRALLCHHHQQQRIAGDVEWYPKRQIGRALIDLQVETVINHIELHQEVAGRQRHLVEISNVPRADDKTPRMRIAFNSLNDLLELINVPLGVLSRAFVQSILRPFTPLIAIN